MAVDGGDGNFAFILVLVLVLEFPAMAVLHVYWHRL
jgi:hypothetical protein